MRNELVDRLDTIPGVRLYLLCHRSEGDVPGPIRDRLGDRLPLRPNLGYDWGACQQFIAAGIHRRHRYVAFMHDDVELLDDELFAAAIRRLDEGATVVGNGRNNAVRDWHEAGESHAYAHSMASPPPRGFRHDTVRGSFLALRSATIDEIGGFEIFWDPYRLMLETGNFSLVATAAKLAQLGGPRAFEFLSEESLRSDYLIEEVRGGRPPVVSLKGRIKRQLVKLYKVAARRVVADRLAGRTANSLISRTARRIVRIFSGVDLSARRLGCGQS